MRFSGLRGASRTRVALAFSGVLILSVLSGCGGGGGGDNGSRQTAQADVTINWPERSRDVNAPTSALSARITFTNAKPNGDDETWIINRTGGATEYSATYRSPDYIVTGSRSIYVDFYADADAGGSFVGTASGTAAIHTDGTGVPQIRVQSGGVASVSVEPMVVGVGEKRQLTISARDDENNLVTVTPGSQFVSITSGANKGRVVQGLYWLLTGLDQGTMRVRAVVDGISGESDMTITTGRSSARPTPLPQAATLQDELNQLSDQERIVNTVALGTDDSWAVLYDSGNAAYQNVPPEFVSELDSVKAQDLIATTAALGDYGSWALVYGRNGFNYRNIPDNMATRLSTLNTNLNAISAIALGPNDSWVILYDQTQFDAENIPSSLRDKLEQSRSGAAAAVTSVALGANNSWVVSYDGRGDFFSSVPSGLETALNNVYNDGYTLTSVALGAEGSYAITYGRNGSYVDATRHQSTRRISKYQNKGHASPRGR